MKAEVSKTEHFKIDLTNTPKISFFEKNNKVGKSLAKKKEKICINNINLFSSHFTLTISANLVSFTFKKINIAVLTC